jgi:hypothetical protein
MPPTKKFASFHELELLQFNPTAKFGTIISRRHLIITGGQSVSSFQFGVRFRRCSSRKDVVT